MKKLSTLFPIGENSSGNENYKHSFLILKRLSVFCLIFFMAGISFGQVSTKALKADSEQKPALINSSEAKNRIDASSRDKYKEKNSAVGQKTDRMKEYPGIKPNRIKSNSKIDNTADLQHRKSLKGDSDFNSSKNNLSEEPTGDDVNSSPFDAVKGKREVTSKRDLYSKTYDNGDGSYTALIGAGPIHYVKNGQFLDIDHKITQNFDQTYPFVNATNLFQSYFGSTSHTGLKNKTDDGELREFLNTKMYWEVNGQPHGLISSANTPIQIEGDKAYYRNLYGSIDVEFTMLSGKRELNYIIPNKAALGDIPANAKYLVFSEDVVLPFGWTHEVTDKGIVIKNALGQSVYLYSNPVSKESSLQLEKGSNTVYETQLIGNTLNVLTKVKTEWLLNNERIFPIKVDPTVSVVPDYGNWWTGYSYQDDDDYEGDIYMGYHSTYSLLMRGFIRINTSVIPVGSTVTNATGYVNKFSQTGNPGNNARFQFYNSADPLYIFGLYSKMTTTLSSNNGQALTNNGWKNAVLTAAGRSYVQNALANGFFAVGMVRTGTWNNQYLGFDGWEYTTCPYFSITYTEPSCAAPTNLNVDTITKNSARFTWNPVGSATNGYDYYYNTTGVAPTGGPSGSVGAGITERTQTGLTPDRVYHFWIRSKCSGGTTSAWTYGGWFNTLPDQECIHDENQGQVKGAVENGYNIGTSIQWVADDFLVEPGKIMTVKQITFEVLATASPSSKNFTLKILDAGLNQEYTITKQPNYTSPIYTNPSGFGTYHVSFTIPDWELSAGQHWFQPQIGEGMFWRTTSNGPYGLEPAITSDDGGANWYYEDDDMIFFVAGDCDDDVNCGPVTATASDYVICSGETVTLTASSITPDYTYTWYTDWDNDTHTGTLVGTGASINVNPTESTLYGVVATKTGCPTGVNAAYNLITIAVTPPPTLIVPNPVETIACTNEFKEINVTGGIIPPEALFEDFDPVKNPWISMTNDDPYGHWGGYMSDGVLHSPDNSVFAITGSYFSYSAMFSWLQSPPISLLDYDTPINLTFNHLFWTDGLSTAKVRVSTDGGLTWDVLRTYTTDQYGSGLLDFKAETINLDTYAGEPYLLLVFDYNSDDADEWFWAIDDIKITGVPLPTSFEWTPYTGLYLDGAGATEYNGENVQTVYASPATTTVYTVTSSTGVGCPSTTTVTVNRGDKNWISPSSTDWNIAANWNEGGVPTADHCVRIPSTSHKPIIDGTTTAFAKNVIIENGGGLTIEGGGSLTVTDYFNHLGTGNEADVVIKHNGNLIQVNDVANTGEITVEKDFKFSADRKQYNYVTAPVVSGRNMKTSIYTPNPTSVQVYNKGNDYFYETPGPYVSGLAYAVKESPGSGTATVAGKLMGVPFNGPLNYTLNTSGNRYNLVGNPYPSNLDIKKLYDNNTTKIESTFYFWDNTSNTLHEQQGSNYNGDHYAKFNAVSNTGTAADCSVYGTGCNKVPDQYVKVGTGFMIQAKTGTLNFTNAYRTTAGNIDFFGKPSGFDTQYDRYWLTMTSPSGTQTMMAVVYFDGGTDEFSADDTKSFQGSNSLFSILDTKQLNIQGRAPFRINDRVPLGYKAFETGTYIIQLEDSDGIFEEGQSIYLIDKLLNKTVKITDKPYKFLTRAGEFNDRFVIVYRPGNIIGTAAEISNQILFAKVDNQIVITSTIDRITEVELFNLNSRSVYKKSDVNSNELRIDALNFNHQIVVVTVKTETGEFVTRKFVNN